MQRAKYTSEFKNEAVRQVIDKRHSVIDVPKRLGIGDLMMQTVDKRFGSNGKPTKTIEWLTDNGSCYTAAETRRFAKQLGLKPVTTTVTSPQSNGMAESFVKTLKRDYPKLVDWLDSKTVMAQLKDWFDDYNSYHPNSALGYLPPTLFREKRSVT